MLLSGPFQKFVEARRIKTIPCVTLVLKTPVFRNLTTAQLASLLKQLAKGASLETLQKQKRGPKNPQSPRNYSGNGKHVATAKLIARRNH